MTLTKDTTKHIRNAEIVALAASGSLTLDEIAAPYGITRERVRQLLTRAGVTPSHLHTVDVVTVMRALRAPTTLSLTRVARLASGSPANVRIALGELGLLGVALRLFRLRKYHQRLGEQRRWVEQYRALAAMLGRRPQVGDLRRNGWFNSNPLGSPFGRNTLAKLRMAAGDPINPRRSRRYGLRGALRSGLLRWARRPAGLRIADYARVTRGSYGSITVTAQNLMTEGRLQRVARGHYRSAAP
mgnify:CR=1 FL=1